MLVVLQYARGDREDVKAETFFFQFGISPLPPFSSFLSYFLPPAPAAMFIFSVSWWDLLLLLFPPLAAAEGGRRLIKRRGGGKVVYSTWCTRGGGEFEVGGFVKKK